MLVARSSASAQHKCLGSGQFGAVIAPLEQVPVPVHGQGNGGVAEPVLHHLRGQGEVAILFAVDAPGGEPVAKAVHAGIARGKDRLTSALAETEDPPEPSAAPEPDVVTTEEEREGFMIVRAIVRDTISAARVHIRDQKSYCGILVDDNNRKPLARLHFNRGVKYLGLFDGDVEERVQISSLDHIYDYSERLRATAAKYPEKSVS